MSNEQKQNKMATGRKQKTHKIHMIDMLNIKFVDGKLTADMNIKGHKVFTSCGQSDYYDRENKKGSGFVYRPSVFKDKFENYPSQVCKVCFSAYLKLQEEKKKINS
jgi:hypothetical protein